MHGVSPVFYAGVHVRMRARGKMRMVMCAKDTRTHMNREGVVHDHAHMKTSE